MQLLNDAWELLRQLQISMVLWFFLICLEYCAYSEGSGNGIEKIKVDGDLDLQGCANKCFQMRLDGNEAINGVTYENTTCYCEVSQTLAFYSKEETNCQFKTDKKAVAMKGERCIYLLSHIQRTPNEWDWISLTSAKWLGIKKLIIVFFDISNIMRQSKDAEMKCINHNNFLSIQLQILESLTQNLAFQANISGKLFIIFFCFFSIL